MSDHVYSWAYKLMFISVLMALWAAFVEPYAYPIKVIMVWAYNSAVLTVLPYEAASFIWDTFLVVVTLELLIWLFHKDHAQKI